MDERNKSRDPQVPGSPFRPDFKPLSTVSPPQSTTSGDTGGLELVPVELVPVEVVSLGANSDGNADVAHAGTVSSVVEAEVIHADSPATDSADPPVASVSDSDQPLETGSRQSSWVLRIFKAFGTFASHLFGIASVIFLLAFAANVPILQLLSFGYLLEVSGRLARQNSFRDAMIGLKKASVVGGILLGTWLTLWPTRLASNFWLEAYLIDPSSNQTAGFRFLQILMITLSLLHIATVWMAGGKLRYFFWPLIAPFSFGVRLFKRMLGVSIVRKVLSIFLGWISPSLVDEICDTRPLKDWFVPTIIWRRIREGNLYAFARDAVWDFTASLNLPYYFGLGLKGFVGTLLWLLIPTTLLVISSYTEDGAAIVSGVLGTLLAIPTFAMLPFMQTHFAKDGKLRRFKEVRTVFKNFGRAPIAHLVALLITLVLALPLFLLKIEQIPTELLWTLSLVFVVFSWPARLIVGWAYRRGARKEKPSRWWVRYPLAGLMLPISLAFVLIISLTRYISWYGALSLFENHVFLLPAPFWL